MAPKPQAPITVAERREELAQLWPLVLRAYKRALSHKNIAIAQRAADAVASRLGLGPVSGLAIHRGRDRLEDLTSVELQREVAEGQKRLADMGILGLPQGAEVIEVHAEAAPVNAEPRAPAPPAPRPAPPRDRRFDSLLAKAQGILGNRVLDARPEAQEDPPLPD